MTDEKPTAPDKPAATTSNFVHLSGDRDPLAHLPEGRRYFAVGAGEKTLCIYHGNCPDGFAAAWVVRRALGDLVEFHPGVYGEEPPSVSGRAVILVDFSYPRAVLERMAEEALCITLLDHHKSARDDLVEFFHPKVWGLFDLGRSGARITWDHFFPAEAPPQLLRHVEDRDLWRFALPHTRAILACLFSFDYDFEVWDNFMARDNLQGMVRDGMAIERKHHKDIEELLKVATRFMEIGGHVVPVANVPFTMASDAAGKLAEGMLFAATYYDTEKERVFSLRSAEDGLDVSLVAKLYGGGGHKHAAGFRVTRAQAWEMEFPAKLPECKTCKRQGICNWPKDLCTYEPIDQAEPGTATFPCGSLGEEVGQP